MVVVRDDAAATGASPFQALTDPSDKLPGRVVVKNASIPWSNAPALGQERIGSTLSIAVDPNKSSIVYVGWADKGSKGDIYTLHVRNSTDRGVTWSKADLPGTTIHNATNVALAIANNGVVGFLYQQLSGDNMPKPVRLAALRVLNAAGPAPETGKKWPAPTGEAAARDKSGFLGR